MDEFLFLILFSWLRQRFPLSLSFLPFAMTEVLGGLGINPGPSLFFLYFSCFQYLTDTQIHSTGLETHYVDQVSLELKEIFLLLSPKGWDDRYTLACLADYLSLVPCTLDLHIQMSTWHLLFSQAFQYVRLAFLLFLGPSSNIKPRQYSGFSSSANSTIVHSVIKSRILCPPLLIFIFNPPIN